MLSGRELRIYVDNIIDGLDSATAIRMIGSDKLYLKILNEYYRNIRNNHDQLQIALSNEDWSDYTIKVHALKSSSKQIGAMDLSEKAAKLEKPCIYAIGNAPTALFVLRDLIDQGQLNAVLIIAVPVGFVNVVESKERIIESAVPYIVARGRKGGSTVAAAICNAMLYQIKRD